MPNPLIPSVIGKSYASGRDPGVIEPEPTPVTPPHPWDIVDRNAGPGKPKYRWQAEGMSAEDAYNSKSIIKSLTPDFSPKQPDMSWLENDAVRQAYLHRPQQWKIEEAEKLTPAELEAAKPKKALQPVQEPAVSAGEPLGPPAPSWTMYKKGMPLLPEVVNKAGQLEHPPEQLRETEKDAWTAENSNAIARFGRSLAVGIPAAISQTVASGIQMANRISNAYIPENYNPVSTLLPASAAEQVNQDVQAAYPQGNTKAEKYGRMAGGILPAMVPGAGVPYMVAGPAAEAHNATYDALIAQGVPPDKAAKQAMAPAAVAGLANYGMIKAGANPVVGNAERGVMRGAADMLGFHTLTQAPTAAAEAFVTGDPILPAVEERLQPERIAEAGVMGAFGGAVHSLGKHPPTAEELASRQQFQNDIRRAYDPNSPNPVGSRSLAASPDPLAALNTLNPRQKVQIAMEYGVPITNGWSPAALEIAKREFAARGADKSAAAERVAAEGLKEPKQVPVSPTEFDNTQRPVVAGAPKEKAAVPQETQNAVEIGSAASLGKQPGRAEGAGDQGGRGVELGDRGNKASGEGAGAGKEEAAPPAQQVAQPPAGNGPQRMNPADGQNQTVADSMKDAASRGWDLATWRKNFPKTAAEVGDAAEGMWPGKTTDTTPSVKSDLKKGDRVSYTTPEGKTVTGLLGRIDQEGMSVITDAKGKAIKLVPRDEFGKLVKQQEALAEENPETTRHTLASVESRLRELHEQRNSEAGTAAEFARSIDESGAGGFSRQFYHKSLDKDAPPLPYNEKTKHLFPGEVRNKLEGSSQRTRSLFTVQGNPSKSGGEEGMATGEEYWRQAESYGEKKSAEFGKIKEQSRGSGDAESMFLADLHDVLDNTAGGKKVPMDDVPPSKINEGDVFTIQGRRIVVKTDPETGEKYGEDGKEMGNIPIERIGDVPMDRGSLQTEASEPTAAAPAAPAAAPPAATTPVVKPTTPVVQKVKAAEPAAPEIKLPPPKPGSAAEAKVELADAVKRAGEILKGTLKGIAKDEFGGIKPEVVSAYLDVAKALVKYNYRTFKEAAAQIKEWMGDAFKDFEPKLREWWTEAKKRNEVDDLPPEPPKGIAPTLKDDEGRNVTSTRNAVMEMERAERGELPMSPTQRKAWQVSVDRAEQAFSKDPDTGKKLVSERIQNPERATTDDEEAVLRWHKVTVQNDARATEKIINDPSTTTEARTAAQDKLMGIRLQMDDYDLATKTSGTAAGRALASRKADSADDYSLVPLRSRYRAAANGEKLSDAEEAAVSRVAEDVRKAEEDYAAGERQRQAEQEAQSALGANEVIDNMIGGWGEERASGKPKAESTASADRIAAGDRAYANIKSRYPGVTVMDMPDEVLPDVKVVVAGRVARYRQQGMNKKQAEAATEDWISNAALNIKDIKKSIADASAEVDAELKDVAKTPAEKKDTAILKVIEKMDDEKFADDPTIAVGSVRKLMEVLWDQGYTSRDGLLDALTNELQQINPAITRREVRDLAAGRGKFTLATTDPKKVGLAHIERQWNMEGHIDDIADGIAPPRKGKQRIPMNQEDRQMDKRFREAKRAGDYEVTNADTQLRSARDEIRARLENSISDVLQEIKTGEKIVPEQTKTKYTPDMLDLQKTLKELRKIHNEMFGKPELTDAEKNALSIKAAQKSLEFYEKKLASGDLTGRGRIAGPESRELQEARAKRDAARDVWDNLRNATDLAKEQRRYDALRRQVEEMEKTVAGGVKKPGEKEQGPDTQAIALLKAKQQQLAPVIAAMRLKANLLDQKIELQRQIDAKTRDIKPDKGKKPPEDAETAGLREQLKITQELYNETFKDEIAADNAKKKLEQYQKRLDFREKYYAEKVKRMEGGDFSKKPKPEAPSLTPQQEEQLERINAAKERADKLVTDRQKQNRYWWEKIADFIPAMSRFNVLSGLTTLIKLPGAAVGETLVARPLQHVAGWILKNAIPSQNIKELFRTAPTEGDVRMWGGINESLREFWKNMKYSLKTGHMRNAVDYGVDTKKNQPAEFMHLPGHVHAAEKSFTWHNEFKRSIADARRYSKENGEDPDSKPIMKRNAEWAARNANDAILMNSTTIGEGVTRMLSEWEKVNPESGHSRPLGKFATSGTRALIPIARVPLNYVGKTMDYALSNLRWPAGVIKVMRGKLAEMSPEDRDLLVRHLKRGSVGMAMGVYAWNFPEHFGGYYQPGQRDKEDTKFGRYRLFGMKSLEIPSILLHNPLFEFGQFVATVKRIKMATDKKTGAEKGLASGLLGAVPHLVKEIPYINEMTNVTRLLESRDVTDLGKQVAGGATQRAMPLLVSQIARGMDQNTEGETITRKPAGAVDVVKQAIPGIRGQVPKMAEKLKGLPIGKLEKAWDDLTPEERSTHRDQFIRKIVNSKMQDRGERDRLLDKIRG